jgi:hypothetical protein
MIQAKDILHIIEVAAKEYSTITSIPILDHRLHIFLATFKVGLNIQVRISNEKCE